MKTKYRHIYFEGHRSGCEASRDDKPVYLCRNNKTKGVLGGVEYYPTWRKYVFEGRMNAVFDISCLRDIIDFMKQL